jgi:hypothetical protein
MPLQQRVKSKIKIAAYVANLARGDILTATDSVEH